MIKKHYKYIFLIVLFVFSVEAVLLMNKFNVMKQNGIVTFPDGYSVMVQVVKSNKAKRKGLSDRQSLGSDKGMLFVYNNFEKHTFWMKDMLFPIDIIWIENDKVVGYDENLLPEYPAKTIYSSDFPINRVLEVNAGFVREHGLEIGDLLDITIPNK